MDNTIEANPKLYKFSDLRQNVWIPKFKWVSSFFEAADIINSWHEDYPKYVTNTETVIFLICQRSLGGISKETLSNKHLNIVHYRDGNGRTFNSFIASLSHILNPELGYLAALQ